MEILREVVREVPVDREVIREVPVEVVREVPVEREVVREVPVEVIKEIVRDVPVEIVREVPVDREVVREVVRDTTQIDEEEFRRLRRRLEELETMQDQLASRAGRIPVDEKMQALLNMAGGVGHVFNNVLAGILGRTQLLVKRASREKSREIASGLHEIEVGHPHRDRRPRPDPGVQPLPAGGAVRPRRPERHRPARGRADARAGGGTSRRRGARPSS